MKFICRSQELDQAVATVQRAVSPRSPMEALGGILIESDGQALKLTGFDAKTGIETRISADVLEEGMILVPSRLFGDIIRKLPDETVSVELEEQLLLKIRSGNADFTIKTMNAQDFPPIPEVKKEDALSLPQNILKKMIDATVFGVSTDESRPLFQGLLLNCLGNQLDLVAIDGFRLCIQRHEFPEGEEKPELKISIPGTALRELSALLEDDEESEVLVYTESNNILFDLGHSMITARLITGEFMDYTRVFPSNYETEIFLNRRAFLDILERAMLLTVARDRRFPIRLQMEDSANLNISINTEVGAFEDKLPIESNGTLVDLTFNPMYFIDALKAIDDEIVKIDFSRGTGPCVVRPPEGEQYDYLILPLRR